MAESSPADATITAAMHVRIRPTNPHDTVVGDFRAWLLEADVAPLPGFNAAGPDVFDGVFDAADYHAVKAWLRERGLVP